MFSSSPEAALPTTPSRVRAPGGVLAAPASRGEVALLTLTLLLLHLAVWAQAAWRRGESFGSLLLHWDAGHYSAIVHEGYSGERWAFYPLYPLTVRALSALLGVEAVQWVGAGLSLGAFLLFVWAVVHVSGRAGVPEGLTPRTRLGWLAFLLAPASYVFHSLHTESLFLLFSFLALLCCGTGRWVAGGLLAAVCVLTRNQGVFLAVGAALLAAGVEGEGRRRVGVFLGVGALAALGAVGFLAFEYVASGTPFAFLQAQSGWGHATSPASVVRTLWFGNPWQSTNADNLLRYGGFWVLVGGTVLLARRQPALAVYTGLSTGVMLLQGELINSFRFGAVLFPLLFGLGDASTRLPRWVQVLLVAGMLVLNLSVTRRYAMGGWAY